MATWALFRRSIPKSLACLVAAVLALILRLPLSFGQSRNLHISLKRSDHGSALHRRFFFYVGGQYVQTKHGKEVVAGQMYVEHLTPGVITKSLPLVMIHGNGMTGTNFLTTLDGRLGWADYFLAEGHEVYIVDQPARGRSAWQRAIDGDQNMIDVHYVEQRFTATQHFGLWPQASLLSQWPGNGSKGDPIFDAFYAGMVPSLTSAEEASNRFKFAGRQLLDKIGPCILLTHSQSGQLGWILADYRPKLVKGIVAIEPIGPPFINAIFPPFAFARPYGLTEISVEYQPPIDRHDDLRPVVAYSQPNFTCMQQPAPARKLVNIAQVPMLVITSESGYHAVYDACTVEYLRSAGVSVDHVRLEDVGLHGNGHMMFMELNSGDIFHSVVRPWVERLS